MLRLIYPQKFQNVYPTTESIQAAARVWGTQLQDFDDIAISKTVDACPDHYTWIPEIAEFKALCKALAGGKSIPWAADVLQRVNADRPSSRCVNAEINLGADITKQLKQLYPEKHWFKEIPGMFTRLKQEARKLFPTANDIELLQEIRKFADEDYQDILN